MGYIYKTHVKNLQISGQKRCLISVDAPYDINNWFQKGLLGLSSGCLKREIEYDENANVEIVSAFYGYSRCLGLGASLLAGLW